MRSRDIPSDADGTGNDPLDQAEWEFCSKSGYDYGGDWEDEFEFDARSEASKRVFKALLKAASPQERVVLKAALAQLKSGRALNWEEIARELGKTSGAIKTQVRRAVAKLLRDKD